MEMGRHRTRYAFMGAAGTDPRDERTRLLLPRNEDLLYRTEYTEMVGLRIRRLREERGWNQAHLAARIVRPRGGRFSAGLVSRVERGQANPPIYAYVHIAEILDLAPGVLMGPRSPEEPVGEAELTLIRFLRRTGMSPDEALVRIVAAGDAHYTPAPHASS